MGSQKKKIEKFENFENFSKLFFCAKLKKSTFSVEIEKIFTIKKVSKFDFKQYRLFKFSKSPILKLSGVLHTFEGWGVPSRRLGNCLSVKKTCHGLCRCIPILSG